MLKEAIAYLVSLKETKTFEIKGATYANQELTYIPPHIAHPRTLRVNGLDSIVKLVQTELNDFNGVVFIRIDNPRRVEVFDELDGQMGRSYAYEAICDAPEFKSGWRDQDAAIIELRSIFVPDERAEYLLDLLSRICKDESVTSVDDGISQTVNVRQGVGLKKTERLKSRILLTPYRTFTEVEQPESEFILRLDNDSRTGLFEADGGRWKLTAKERIKAYFEERLAAEIEQARVVVMM